MGSISFNLDPVLLQAILERVRLTLFIETGTFLGDTIEVVHPLFDQCFSIELSATYFEAARKRFTHQPNVEIFQGESPAILAKLKPRFTGTPTFFWLDAHWCAASNTAGEKSQCPLLQELQTIGSLDVNSVIAIDDARLFLSPPPAPHEISAWPEFDEIITALRRLSPAHALLVHNDVILFMPRAIAKEMKSFLQDHNVDTLGYLEKSRAFDDILKQAREKEVIIANLKEEAEKRLALIIEKDGQLKELHSLLQTAHDTNAEKEAKINDLAEKCDQYSKLRIPVPSKRHTPQSHDMSATLRRRFFTWLIRNTRNHIGRLAQHPPRVMTGEKIPASKIRADWPRICIITPSYNQGRFLERTMDSILGQNYPKLAYGVQDGGSTDESADIITRRISQLTHAESAKDEGQADAIQRGFKKLFPVSEDIMAWVNSDDVLLPGTLAYVGNFFARHPEIDVIYGHRVIIDQNDLEIGRWYMPRHHQDTLPWFDLVPQETLFWRASCFEQIGGLDPAFHFAMDWDLLLRFEQAGFRIHRVPYFLGCFRVHTDQKTSAKIHTLGEQEMRLLRTRTHCREIRPWEIHRHLKDEIGRSAFVAWLHRFGIRY